MAVDEASGEDLDAILELLNYFDEDLQPELDEMAEEVRTPSAHVF